MILVAYNNTEIISVQEAPEGVTYTKHFLIKDTKENALSFFQQKGFDTSMIEEFEFEKI